jgi:hypothetical protein
MTLYEKNSGKMLGHFIAPACEAFRLNCVSSSQNNHLELSKFDCTVVGSLNGNLKQRFKFTITYQFG